MLVSYPIFERFWVGRPKDDVHDVRLGCAPRIGKPIVPKAKTTKSFKE